MCMTKTHNNMDSHSYKDMHDKKPIRIWIVIRTEMYTKKTHNKLDSHSYRDVHDENLE